MYCQPLFSFSQTQVDFFLLHVYLEWFTKIQESFACFAPSSRISMCSYLVDVVTFSNIFSSIPEKVFFINPGSQDETVHRPHHFLETTFCLLNPDCIPECLKTMCWGVPRDHWGGAMESRYWTSSFTVHACKHWIATLLYLWKVTYVLCKWYSKKEIHGLHGTVGKTVVLQ